MTLSELKAETTGILECKVPAQFISARAFHTIYSKKVLASNVHGTKATFLITQSGNTKVHLSQPPKISQLYSTIIYDKSAVMDKL